MSAKDSRPGSQAAPRAASGKRNAAGGDAPLTDAARAWTALVDGWWRQQAAVLPPELERAMSATLNQSKALVEMAFAQAAGAMAASSGGPHGAATREPEDAEATGEFGLWQPIIDACRACEASLVGSLGDDTPARSGAGEEYQRAASAYLNEFLQINRDVARRLQAKIAASPPADFRQLHDLVVEEAESAYLERVSSDEFAALQAAYINAMFRLRRESEASATKERE